MIEWAWVLVASSPVSVQAAGGVARFEQQAPDAFDRVDGFAPAVEVGLSVQPLKMGTPLPWGSWTLSGSWLTSARVESGGASSRFDRLRFETWARWGWVGPILSFERFHQSVDGVQDGLQAEVLSVQAGVQADGR